MVAMSGFGEPRRENRPPDDFLFLLFESTLTFYKKLKNYNFFSYSFIHGSDEWIRTADLTGMNRLL